MTHSPSRLARFLLACYPADYRARYGAELLAVSRERAGQRRWPGLADIADLLTGAVRVRWTHRADRADGARNWRAALPLLGLLGPLVLVCGIASDLHQIAWFVLYGGFALPWWQEAGDTPLWVAWAVVAVCAALGRRRIAAVLAWLATAATVIGVTTVPVLPPVLPMTSAWLLLGLLCALALSLSPATGVASVGVRRWWMVAGAVGLVLLTSLLGHNVRALEVIAWVLLALAVGRACQPATGPGLRALALLSAPASIALLGVATLYVGDLGFVVIRLPWAVADGALLALALLELGAVALALRLRDRTRPARPEPRP